MCSHGDMWNAMMVFPASQSDSHVKTSLVTMLVRCLFSDKSDVVSSPLAGKEPKRKTDLFPPNANSDPSGEGDVEMFFM